MTTAPSKDATLLSADFPCEHRYRARTSVISSSLFTKNVESSLPYREVTTKVSLPYSGFMIDDERIIGCKWVPIILFVIRDCRFNIVGF